jgi:uncharacterized protein YkwD
MKTIVATLALALVAPMHDAAAAESRNDGYAMQLGKLINEYRAEHGLQPLALVAPLSELAREQAARMARENRLSHDGFQQRFERARSPACVENVGSYDGPPEIEFAAWRDSPVHAHNLLDARITRMGIARERSYVAFFACR